MNKQREFMLDTIDGTHKGGFFEPSLNDRLLERHLHMSSIQSRLLSLRGLLGRVAEQHVKDFSFRNVALNYVEETYALDFQDFTIRVQIRTYHVCNPSERRVAKPETALSINRVLRGIEAASPSRDNELARNQYFIVRELVQKLFVLASSETQYQTTCEEDYWSLFFNDPKAATQAEIEVERK
jgi:hypothetical protein